MTTYNMHLGVGQRFRFLLVLFCAIMIILPSSFFSAGQTIDDESPAPNSNDASQDNDWTYYLQLPISLVLILILMVVMMAYVRRVDE